MSVLPTRKIVQQLSVLTSALTTEKDHEKLLDQIIDGCMTLTNADGGTLYTLNEENENELLFTVIRNRSLGIHRKPSEWPPIHLCNSQGKPANLVVVHSFLERKVINIANAYNCKDFDFSGTRQFDKQLNYRSESFLCVPLEDHEGEIIGVLQLINAQDENGKTVPFSNESAQFVHALASLAATVLTKRRLIESQKQLFESFIKLIGRAIDHKSPVTGKHCEQVPEIAMLLAEAVNDADTGDFADTSFSEEQLYELRIAAWLHDCGKITTPEYIIDKATKLHTMFDRIELIEARVQLLKQQLELDFLRKTGGMNGDEKSLMMSEYVQEGAELDEHMAFIRQSNTGSEFMSEQDQQKIRQIALIRWTDDKGQERPLLTQDEVENLCISKGTLTEDERQVMRDHIKISIEMLEPLKYPKPLAQVPEIACNHHEHLDGTGYPRGLTADALSLRARIMCIADIFEALTSPDRPYKKGMMLSQAMTILGRMVEDNHLDPQLFSLFVESGAYRRYAEQHMSDRQIDEFDEAELPGMNYQV